MGDEKKLTIWDLHGLLFLLATVANKWRAIGGGLHFPDDTLNVIGQKLVCIVGGSVQCLCEMLAQWLGRDKPPECGPATTCALAVVLRHPSVNEGQLADTLEGTFQPAGIYITTVLQCHVSMLDETTFLFLGCHPGVGELCISAIMVTITQDMSLM